MWLFFALASAALYGVAEILDNFLANREFKHPFTLVFYASIFNVIYVPLFWLAERPTMPPLSTIPIFILLGFVNVSYLYPYYRGLKVDDTSIAISFLAIERIMVPVLAFFVVGEILQPVQYLGIAVVIASVVLLGLHHSRKKFTFSKGMLYISVAALFLAIEAVLLKLLFNDGVTVGTAVTGESLMTLCFGLSIFLLPRVRKDILRTLPLFARLTPIFCVEEAFTFLGLFTESKAISETSVSLVKGISMISPFFLIVYAWIFGNLFPVIFKEDLHRRNVARELALFTILVIGVMLIRG